MKTLFALITLCTLSAVTTHSQNYTGKVIDGKILQPQSGYGKVLSPENRNGPNYQYDNNQDASLHVLDHGGLKDGLMAYYPFAGSSRNDIQNRFHSFLKNNAAYTEDRFGRKNSAIELDGILSSVVIEDSVLNIKNDYTLSGWFMTSDISKTYQTIINTSPHTGIGIGWNNSRALNSLVWALGPANADWTLLYERAHGFQMLENHWHAFAFVKDGIAYSLYLDGELYSGRVVIESRGYDQQVGFIFGEICPETECQAFKGKLDDFRIYDRPLSSSEVKSLFETESLPPENVNPSLKVESIFARSGESATVTIKSSFITQSDSLTSYQFSLPIPQGLEFVNARLPEGFSVDGDLLSNMVSDTLRISFATKSQYINGDSVLAHIELKGTDFGSFTLSPTNVFFNSTPVDSITSGTFTVVSLLKGDVNEDSLILAHDAAMVNWYSVGADPLPNQDPLPWDPWRIEVADVNSDGEVLAEDASLILQKTVGLINEFPDGTAKSLYPVINVRAESNALYFSTEEQGLIGVNVYLPNQDGVDYIDAEFISDGLLTATNRTDEGFSIGIASLQELKGDFLRIPINTEPTGSLSFKLYANSTLQEVKVGLSGVNTSVELESGLPTAYALEQNYPNPFNPTTQITYSLVRAQSVRVEVYSVTGEKVATLVNSTQAAGVHTVEIDGSTLSSGVYLYRIITPEFTKTRSMFLLK